MSEHPVVFANPSRHKKHLRPRDRDTSKSPFLTTMEAVECLRTYPLQLYKLVREGKVSAVKVGREYRFYKNEIERFVRNDN